MTVIEREADNHRDEETRKRVTKVCTTMGVFCRRRRRIGKIAKACIEFMINAKTAISVNKREAMTADAEMAAFIDKTEVSRSRVWLLGLCDVYSANRAFKINKMADIAHTESEEVAAVRVRNTGESDTREMKIRRDDLTDLRSEVG